MFYDFPDIGNNTPNWLSYFSEGLKTPTSYILYVYVCIYIYTSMPLANLSKNDNDYALKCWLSNQTFFSWKVGPSWTSAILYALQQGLSFVNIVHICTCVIIHVPHYVHIYIYKCVYIYIYTSVHWYVQVLSWELISWSGATGPAKYQLPLMAKQSKLAKIWNRKRLADALVLEVSFVSHNFPCHVSKIQRKTLWLGRA